MSRIPLLSRIENPADLKKLTPEQLPQLAEELRQVIVEVVSQNGGHLASNLGAIELTLALHYVFDSPNDLLVWDVGHQCYAHKLLTGRRDEFHTLRTHRGIAGFPKREESVHDPINTGHASTSISTALGIAEGFHLTGKTGKVVAVIGDGSLTGGLAYEALNMAGHRKKDLIVVLNDNEMSIAPNVGALSHFLSLKMGSEFALKVKREIKTSMKSIPRYGEHIYQMAKKVDTLMRRFLSPGLLFEAFGFSYVGPIFGHNLTRLIDCFTEIKQGEGPLLVHVSTHKGKGFRLAEENPSKFHGIGPFHLESGEVTAAKGNPTYTEVLGKTLCQMAREDEKIVAITAAMPGGTGLSKFAAEFPQRFFDVGICEQHAVTFACGLATQGLKPLVAIYSTFLQRAFDQIIHDAALMNLPVVFAIDRGGLVGDDGPTHHGVFDLSYLRLIPNLTLMAPRHEAELMQMLKTAFEIKGPVAIRYPRGEGTGVALPQRLRPLEVGQAEVALNGNGKKHLSILAVGHLVEPALEAARLLKEERIYARVINARFIKPLDEKQILHEAMQVGRLLTVEENAVRGGFGAGVLELLSEKGVQVQVRCLGLPDQFVEHGAQEILRRELGLDAAGIAAAARALVGQQPQETATAAPAKPRARKPRRENGVAKPALH